MRLESPSTRRSRAAPRTILPLTVLVMSTRSTPRGPDMNDMKRTASEEIWDLLVHCCFLLDHGRKSEIPGSIFTDDGIYDHGSGAVVGREALDAQFADVASPHLDGTAHYLSNF